MEQLKVKVAKSKQCNYIMISIYMAWWGSMSNIMWSTHILGSPKIGDKICNKLLKHMSKNKIIC